MGTLYIVSTPIGNLKDITLRAIETLKSVDYILCEDTRITGKLLYEYGISKKMIPLTDFNEAAKTPQLISDLIGGKNIALVSDAGTPLVSDPGFKLVREALGKGLKIESIAGPTALISALTVSGKPTDKFLFLGYLSKKEGRRKELLEKIHRILHIVLLTVIIYESPYRLVRTLTDIKEIYGNIEIVICRELTKLHEEVRRENISESIQHFSKVQPRGELTIVF